MRGRNCHGGPNYWGGLKISEEFSGDDVFQKAAARLYPRSGGEGHASGLAVSLPSLQHHDSEFHVGSWYVVSAQR